MQTQLSLQKLGSLITVLTPDLLEILIEQNPQVVAENLETLQQVCDLEVRRQVLEYWLESKQGYGNQLGPFHPS